MKILLISIFIAVSSHGQSVQGQNVYPMSGCIPGFTNFGKFCYKYFWERLPYDEAQAKCATFQAGPLTPKGYVITAKDIQHNRFQHNWLRYTGGGNNKIWMGLYEKRNDVYFWADETPFLPGAWNRFKPDQPQQNAHIQAVHTFDNSPDNTWVTSSIETQMSFICQYQYMP
ncbi:lithostathine-like [Diadema antillarum]|uniref:lithostathine-like n=1 Tax=Diadema antillarum TaxID=105358 RepID=UPI003A880D24